MKNSKVEETVTIAGSDSGFADGDAKKAKFNYPYGLAIDRDGNILVTDICNYKIRKIDLENGKVLTLAGVGQGYQDGFTKEAKFNGTSGLTVDKFGNIIIAEQANNRIRKITPKGVVTTIAGDGKGGFEDGNHLKAKFHFPLGVTTDGEGNIYVADFRNHRIRKITTDGEVSTVAGDGATGYKDGISSNARFNGPAGVAVDREGNIYVADYGNHLIRKISNGEVYTFAGDGNSGFKDGPGTKARFYNPRSIVIDSEGTLIVTDQNNHRIRKISPTGLVTTIAGEGVSGYKDGPNISSKFNQPIGVAIDNSGNIYVTDYSNHKIRKLTALGIAPGITWAGLTSSSGGVGGLGGGGGDPSSLIHSSSEDLSGTSAAIGVPQPLLSSGSNPPAGVGVGMFGTSPVGHQHHYHGVIGKEKNFLSLSSSNPPEGRDEESNIRDFLSKLLQSTEYADLVIHVQGNEIKLHKAIVSVRCPKLLTMSTTPIPYEPFQALIRFLYTNTLPPIDQLHKIHLHLLAAAKSFDFTDLESLLQYYLLTHIQPENAFDLLLEASRLSLKTEVDWLIYFIGKFKLLSPPSFPADAPIAFKLSSELTSPSLPPPPTIINPPRPKSLVSLLEYLYLSKQHTDFTLVVKGTPILVHKCVVAPKWSFFSHTVAKSKSMVEHDTAMPVSTLEKLVGYFYTGSLSGLNWKDCAWVLSLEGYYHLQRETKLIEECHRMVDNNISANNWVEVIQQAIEIKNNNLKKKALAVVPPSMDPQLLNLCLKLLEDNNSLTYELRQTRIQLTATEDCLQQTVSRLDKIESFLASSRKQKE